MCDTNRSCDSCNYCYSCNYCNYCYSCDYCDFCQNLKMTEFNIFCYSKKYNEDNSFQQKRYRAFNKEVREKRYNEIKSGVSQILGTPKMNLTDFWKQVTQEQWQKLLAIPEAKDFTEGFEYISGQKIDVGKIKITVEGKDMWISRESAEALGLVKKGE